jgi:AraC-like DNA-binding protein
MELASRPPHPALAPHVRSLAGWHERADGPVRRSELPGGRIVLVVSLGPTLDVDGRSFGSFVAGLHDTPALTEHAGEGYGVQAYLTPLGACRLLRMPMGELAGDVVELGDLIGREADVLAERLAEAPDWPARLALLERALAARVLEAPAPAPELERAWDRLLETGGAVPVGTLAAELGWSRRHFAATFREQVGMPPKPLARLLRFESAVERLRAGGELADVAYESGYYDQAHFNRDFKQFAGRTPTEYLVASVQDITSLAA